MKKSFNTTAFDEVKKEIKEFVIKNGGITCNVSGLVVHKNMLWLQVESKGQMAEWHSQLDGILKERFAIPVDRFDANFQPHISLFTKGSEGQIKEMYELLKPQLTPFEMTISKFVIGSSLHKDEFFEV